MVLFKRWVQGMFLLGVIFSSASAQKAERLYTDGMELYNAGEYKKAADRFLEALDESEPDKGKLHFALANTFQYWEKDSLALHHYDMALFHGYTDKTEVLYQQSTLYFSKRNYPKAIECCEKILEGNPQSQDKRVYSRLNIIYSIQGEADKAKAVIIRGARAGIREFQTNCERRGINWKE